MIMIQGTGTISNYTNYISNCKGKQMPYQIPVNSLDDVQLFISIGTIKPSAVQYELIHTCGPDGGTIINITPGNYVIGQDSNLNWYGVFKNFIGSTPNCFVVAITLTIGISEIIYFSEEYCLESCAVLTKIKGCYGNLDSKISYDCEGVYFGKHAGIEDALGNISIVYQHELYLRNVEVSLAAIKNTFKQGLTRNFRTEKEKIFQFYAEFIPEWYISEIDAVFYRGEVFVDTVKYLVNETQFEKIEDCKRMWKPAATFKESCLQSFSCETDPCTVPAIAIVCCDPVVIGAVVTTVPFESGFPVESGSGAIGANIIVVQAVVDSAPFVTGTGYPVIGIVDGSLIISCAAFAGKRIYMERGSIFVPGIDPGDGSVFYTKNIADSFITCSQALAHGELIYIEAFV